MWILILTSKFASPTFNYRSTSTFILCNSITISSMFVLYYFTDFFKNMYLKTEEFLAELDYYLPISLSPGLLKIFKWCLNIF